MTEKLSVDFVNEARARLGLPQFARKQAYLYADRSPFHMKSNETLFWLIMFDHHKLESTYSREEHYEVMMHRYPDLQPDVIEPYLPFASDGAPANE